MNNRPTPETDAFSIKFKTPCGEKYWVPADFSHKLERERDEARKMLVRSNHFLQQAEENLESIYKERDELLNEIKRLRLDAQREAEQHDRMVKELEGLYDKLKS